MERWNPDNVIGTFTHTPKGVILHGSRSGIIHSVHSEFVSLSNYGKSTELAFNASIGEDEVALHLNPTHWGWNARGCSGLYLAIEFSQSTVQGVISDGQVRAFCIWLRDYVLPIYPNLPRYFPTHAELDGTDEYGTFDGKTDVFPDGDWRTTDLRNRINAHLKFFKI